MSRARPCFWWQPNNPTGQTLTDQQFAEVANFCTRTRTILVLDHTFRFYRRRPFDDYAILRDCETSFIAFEDTGKVWPTHDLKASLLLASGDLRPLVRLIYDEVYLCHSRFALRLLERCLVDTERRGLTATVWRAVDERRERLREELADGPLTVDPSAVGSDLSIEWLSCRGTRRDDLQLRDVLAAHGVRVLPGRSFYWASSTDPRSHRNIRVALLKPRAVFEDAVTALAAAARHLGDPVTA